MKELLKYKGISHALDDLLRDCCEHGDEADLYKDVMNHFKKCSYTKTHKLVHFDHLTCVGEWDWSAEELIKIIKKYWRYGERDYKLHITRVYNEGCVSIWWKKPKKVAK